MQPPGRGKLAEAETEHVGAYLADIFQRCLGGDYEFTVVFCTAIDFLGWKRKQHATLNHYLINTSIAARMAICTFLVMHMQYWAMPTSTAVTCPAMRPTTNKNVCSLGRDSNAADCGRHIQITLLWVHEQ